MSEDWDGPYETFEKIAKRNQCDIYPVGKTKKRKKTQLRTQKDKRTKKRYFEQHGGIGGRRQKYFVGNKEH